MANGTTWYSGARTPEEIAQAERAWQEYESRPEQQARKEKLTKDLAPKVTPPPAKPRAKKEAPAPTVEDIITRIGAPPPPSETAERKPPSPEKTSMLERTAMAQAQAADMMNARAGINSNYTGQVLGLVEHTRSNREADLMRRAFEKSRVFSARQDWQRAEMLGTIAQLTRMAGAERESAEQERMQERMMERERQMRSELTPAQREQFALQREQLEAQRETAETAGARQERVEMARIEAQRTLASLPYEKMTAGEKAQADMMMKKLGQGTIEHADLVRLKELEIGVQGRRLGVEERGAEEAVAASKAQRRAAELAASMAEAETTGIAPELSDMIQMARTQADEMEKAGQDKTIRAYVDQEIARATQEYRARISRGESPASAGKEAARLLQFSVGQRAGQAEVPWWIRWTE